jgi:hypothetical protein
MSEPKRYHLYAGLDVHAFAKAEAVLKFSVEDDGMWVRWEDYARLKAQVERLTAEVSYDNRVQLHIDKLAEEFTQAQVERLTKAGDELHAFLINYIVEMRVSSSYLNKLDDDWNAAKEGKQP